MPLFLLTFLVCNGFTPLVNDEATQRQYQSRGNTKENLQKERKRKEIVRLHC